MANRTSCLTGSVQMDERQPDQGPDSNCRAETRERAGHRAPDPE